MLKEKRYNARGEIKSVLSASEKKKQIFVYFVFIP